MPLHVIDCGGQSGARVVATTLVALPAEIGLKSRFGDKKIRILCVLRLSSFKGSKSDGPLTIEKSRMLPSSRLHSGSSSLKTQSSNRFAFHFLKSYLNGESRRETPLGRSNMSNGEELLQKRDYNEENWGRWFSVRRAVWLDHLHPFKTILLLEFSIYFTLIVGGQFLLSQRANSENGEKRELFQFQNWMRHRGLSAWGIQTRPFVSL